MEQNIKTAFVVGILILVIFSLFLTYASLSDPSPIKSIKYQETPPEDAHSLYADGVIVL
jgi:hypothetical protein